MAGRMKTSTEKIEHNLMAFPYSRISAVYFIAKDTLIKEVLYPPREMRRSFLFEIECKRRARLASIAGLEDDEKEDESESERFSTTTRDSEVDDGIEEKSTVSRASIKKDSGNNTSRRKSGGDYANRNLPLIQPLKKVEILEKFMDSIPEIVTGNLNMKQKAEQGDGKSVSFDESGDDLFPSYNRNRLVKQTKLDRNNPPISNEKKSKDNRYSRIPEVNLNTCRNEVYPINMLELGEKLRRVCEIGSHKAKRKEHEKEKARDIMEFGEKLKRVGEVGSYEVKNRHERETTHLSESRSMTTQRNEAISRLVRTGQGNPFTSKLQTPDSLNRSSYSRTSSRGFPTNVSLYSTSSGRQKPTNQERFLQVTNEGLSSFKQTREQMSVGPHRSSKVPVSEFHFGSPSSFSQKLAFGPSPTRDSRSTMRHTTRRHDGLTEGFNR